VRAAPVAEPPALIKPRLHVVQDPAAVPAVLDRIGRSRSAGVILHAPEVPGVPDALRRLPIPVVPFVADLPGALRSAGTTAAYLVEQWMADRAGDVLVTGAAGDDLRVAAFRAAVAATRRLLTTGQAGSGATALRGILARNPAVRAVYALGGDTADVIEAFAAERRHYDVFVAHGLDAGNVGLLGAGRISAVLHHDLRGELRQACAALFGSVYRPPGAAVTVLTPHSAIPGDGPRE